MTSNKDGSGALAVGEQGHEATYACSNGIEIRVVQDTRKCDGMGGEVWAGAFILCEYLDQHKQIVDNKSVVELGAGCGLCGLVTAALGASKVVLTDEYPELLPPNIELNVNVLNTSLITSEELIWGPSSGTRKFDVVLGSEVTQVGRAAHQPLLQSVCDLLSTSGTALFSMDACCADCSGKCGGDKCSASHFIEEAERQGLEVQKQPNRQLIDSTFVKNTVGALGKKLMLDEDDYSVIIRLSRS